MENQSYQITTLHELQRRVPSFVKAINADERLAAGAAANPLLALEELGFSIASELRPKVEWRVRFSLETFNRLESLTENIFQQVGGRFNIDSSSELARVLFDELKLPRPGSGPTQQAVAHADSIAGEVATAPLPYYMKKSESKVIDPLEELRGSHPVIEPLLEYRRLEATSPRLATPESYRKIRTGETELPIKRLRFNLQRGRAPE